MTQPKKQYMNAYIDEPLISVNEFGICKKDQNQIDHMQFKDEILTDSSSMSR